MLRKAIIWADFGAILGTIGGIVWAITDDFDTPRMTIVVLTALTWGIVWMSIGAITGILAALTEAKGITLGSLAFGFVGAVVSAFCVGLLWWVIASAAEGRLLERYDPWGIIDSGPNLTVIGAALNANLFAIGAAGISFLTWASVACGRRPMAWALAVVIAAGVCFLLSTRKLPVREDFRWNLKQREEVVALARAGKLPAYSDPSADRRLKVLPLQYRHLSDDGLVWVERASGNTTVIFHRSVDGPCFSAFYYVANDQPPNEAAASVKKMAPHWFFASGCS